MMKSLWSAATGMQAQNLNIDVIANNLANVNTSGFKKSRADFQDLLYETMKLPGASSSDATQTPTGIQVGHGTRPAATQQLFTQGDFQFSQNPLHMSIEGSGFFQILQPNGELAYSRAGTFKLDSEGRIVTSNGFCRTGLQDGNDAIRADIDGDDIIRNGDLRFHSEAVGGNDAAFTVQFERSGT